MRRVQSRQSSGLRVSEIFLFGGITPTEHTVDWEFAKSFAREAGSWSWEATEKLRISPFKVRDRHQTILKPQSSKPRPLPIKKTDFDPKIHGPWILHEEKTYGNRSKFMFKYNKIVDMFREFIQERKTPMPTKLGIAHQAIEASRRLPPRVISLLFHACKKGAFVHRPLFVSLGNQILRMEDMGEFTVIDLCVTIQSLGTLAAIDRDQLEYKRRGNRPHDFDMDKRSLVMFRNCSALARKLVEEFHVRVRNGAFTALGATNVVFGLGWLYEEHEGLDMRPEVMELLDTLIPKMCNERHLGSFKFQNLSSICYGCANMGYPKGPWLDSICREAGKRFAKSKVPCSRWSDANIKGLAHLLHGMGKYGHVDQGVVDMAAHVIAQCAFRMDLKCLSNFAYGCGKLGVTDEAAINALGNEIVRQDRLEKCSRPQLVGFVEEFAKIAPEKTEVFEALGSEICKEQRLPLFRNIELAGVTRALKVAGVVDGSSILDIIEKELEKRWEDP